MNLVIPKIDIISDIREQKDQGVVWKDDKFCMAEIGLIAPIEACTIENVGLIYQAFHFLGEGTTNLENSLSITQALIKKRPSKWVQFRPKEITPQLIGGVCTSRSLFIADYLFRTFDFDTASDRQLLESCASCITKLNCSEKHQELVDLQASFNSITVNPWIKTVIGYIHRLEEGDGFFSKILLSSPLDISKAKVECLTAHFGYRLSRKVSMIWRSETSFEHRICTQLKDLNKGVHLIRMQKVEWGDAKLEAFGHTLLVAKTVHNLFLIEPSLGIIAENVPDIKTNGSAKKTAKILKNILDHYSLNNFSIYHLKPDNLPV